MMRLIRFKKLDAQARSQPLEEKLLERIRGELPNEDRDKVVAINLDTGEYVTGDDYWEAFRAFLDRFPNGSRHICRLDGSPAIRM